MIANRFSFGILLLLTLFILIALPSSRAKYVHEVQKRQIGVLARAGALPQGKRSVEILARNGELPGSFCRRYPVPDRFENVPEAEGPSGPGLRAFEDEDFREAGKRSVAALARNGQLPRKRLTDVAARSGYLVKPPREAVRLPGDPFDPEDFLAGVRSSEAFGFTDKRNVGSAKNFFLDTDKRTLGSAKNFLLSGGRGSKSSESFYEKKNLAPFARDGGFSSLGYPPSSKEPGDRSDGFGFDYLARRDYEKDAGPAKNFGKREIRGSRRDGSDFIDKSPPNDKQKAAKGESLSGTSEKPGGDRRKREVFPERSQQEYAIPYYQVPAEIDCEDFPVSEFYDRENSEVEKRFLGRIPQLGRIHQKVKSPSTRRRPSLRPNWL